MKDFPECPTMAELMEFPPEAAYNALYMRYLDPLKTHAMVEYAGSLRGKMVLDIAGGNGRLARVAVEQGAKLVRLVDPRAAMLNPDPRITLEPQGIEFYLQSTWRVRRELQNEFYDAVFCQQGVNYWFCEETIEALVPAMTRDGVFVFNTFRVQPPTTPKPLEYNIQGRHYIEVSWLINNVVYHVQIAEGYSPHMNAFRWIPREEFEQVLSPYFHVEVQRREKTLLFVCRRK